MHGVTHFCAAPVVHNSILSAPPEDTTLPLPHTVNVNTSGSSPLPSVLLAMSQTGFRVTHVYGLTEINGPATVCARKPEWNKLSPEAPGRLNARQGVRTICLEGLDVKDTLTKQQVPAYGKINGEIVMRGNAVMKGYLRTLEPMRKLLQMGGFTLGIKVLSIRIIISKLKLDQRI